MTSALLWALERTWWLLPECFSSLSLLFFFLFLLTTLLLLSCQSPHFRSWAGELIFTFPVPYVIAVVFSLVCNQVPLYLTNSAPLPCSHPSPTPRLPGAAAAWAPRGAAPGAGSIQLCQGLEAGMGHSVPGADTALCKLVCQADKSLLKYVS